VKSEPLTNSCCFQLTSLLLPYLEEFDENEINLLATHQKGFGISVDAVTTSERSAGFRLVFAKEKSSADHIAMLLEDRYAEAEKMSSTFLCGERVVCG
jgi:hypothetical protein